MPVVTILPVQREAIHYVMSGPRRAQLDTAPSRSAGFQLLYRWSATCQGSRLRGAPSFDAISARPPGRQECPIPLGFAFRRSGAEPVFCPVPQGRAKIAHPLMGGFRTNPNPQVPIGTKESTWFSEPSNAQPFENVCYLPSLSGLPNRFTSYHPPLKRWAIFVCPCGTQAVGRLKF